MHVECNHYNVRTVGNRKNESENGSATSDAQNSSINLPKESKPPTNSENSADMPTELQCSTQRYPALNIGMRII